VSIFALRTVVLPFVWIFNAQLLLIDVHGWWELTVVVVASTLACLVFAAATMGYFQTKSRWWETALLLLATFMLFRPNFFMDQFYEPYQLKPAKEIYEVAKSSPDGYPLILIIEGTSVEGDDIKKTVAVALTKPGEGRARLSDAGVTLTVLGDEVRIATVKFGSRAKRSGFEQGWKVTGIQVDSGAPTAHWVFIPAVALVAFIFFLQRRRMRAPPANPVAVAA
jgi:hypothetical protein